MKKLHYPLILFLLSISFLPWGLASNHTPAERATSKWIRDQERQNQLKWQREKEMLRQRDRQQYLRNLKRMNQQKENYRQRRIQEQIKNRRQYENCAEGKGYCAPRNKIVIPKVRFEAPRRNYSPPGKDYSAPYSTTPKRQPISTYSQRGKVFKFNDGVTIDCYNWGDRFAYFIRSMKVCN